VPRIWLGDIRIDAIARSSAVFAGDNRLLGRGSRVKANQAFGTVNGQRVLLWDVNSAGGDEDRIDIVINGKRNGP